MAEAMRFLIAEPDGFSSEAMRIISEVSEVKCHAISQTKVRGALEKFDGVWIRLQLKVSKSDIPKDPRCKYLVTATTGTDHIDVEAAEKAGIQVISLKGNTDFLKTITATAEHTLGLILALVRYIPFAFESVRNGEWNRDFFRGHELQGKTAGIVGYGRLGRIVVNYLKVLGMRVIIYDPYVSLVDSDIEQKANLEELLREADLISVHVNLNSETEDLFDELRFAQMKPTAFLINTSRGAVVNERALLDALKRGHIAGAALDVLCGEPNINEQHPLVDYAVSQNNLILTPHIGGATYESMQKCEIYLADCIAKNILRNGMFETAKADEHSPANSNF